jgi:hypothetical protein
MTVGWRLAVLGVVFLGMPVDAGAACRVSDLSWMTGRWNFHNGAYSARETWNFSESGLVEFVTGSGVPSSGGVVKLSAISSEQGALVLRMRFFDGSLKHALEDKDARWFSPLPPAAQALSNSTEQGANILATSAPATI